MGQGPGTTATATVALLLSATATSGRLLGGYQSSTATERPQEPVAPIFRATTELVQFDAIVLDRGGNAVTSLRREDFAVRQDGVGVSLEDAIYVDRVAIAVDAARRAADDISVVEIDAEPLVILVDDMAMTPDGFHRVRRGLRRFVTDGLPAGVEVGILRTGETGRRTTTLSADRREILERVDGMRYLARSLRPGLASGSGAAGPGTRQRERTFLEGTLGSVNSLLADLRRLPGRKTLVLLSEGVTLDAAGAGAVEPRLNRLAQLAAEARVTLHTIDVTGVGGAAATLQLRMSLRDGLVALAQRMGGLFLEHSNDLDTPLIHVASIQRGYYLLSYAPPPGTFVDAANPPFRKLSVSLPGRDLRVMARPGFFGRR
jgi:VWFA-related protein